MAGPLRIQNFSKAAEVLISLFPAHLKLAAPLGLGKPIKLLNKIYEGYRTRPDSRLDIFTALSLTRPGSSGEFEKRFAEPFIERHFGEDYPDLRYVKDSLSGELPNNINIYEFYFQAGQYLHSERAQASYISLNYTHVAQSLFRKNIHAVVQLVAKHPSKNTYSLCSNPDLTLDVIDLFRKSGKPFYVVGVVHPGMPFMVGDAEVSEDYFNMIVDSPEMEKELFALPKAALDTSSIMIGLHSSQFVRDDGTLQIGIGSLSDALVYSTVLRHQKNDLYQKHMRKWWSDRGTDAKLDHLHWGVFEKGIYGTSELIFDGFMHLYRAGILNRRVRDRKNGPEIFLLGAFFLGSKEFYQWLRDLSEEERRGIGMTSVSKVNDLYDEDEMALRRQRKNARFFNSSFSMSLLGEAGSDTLPSGQVVSGVGGQYNFVAMSQEMPDARSILMLKSTRTKGGRRSSNVSWTPGYATVPRHLRDIVVTEYGIADLLYKTDEEVICALLAISDVEFQEDLIIQAQKHQKLSRHYRLPSYAYNNHPGYLENFLQEARTQGIFPEFPFGTDFTSVEEKVYSALMRLKKSSGPLDRVQQLYKGLTLPVKTYEPELRRMKLWSPKNVKEQVFQRILLAGLAESAGDRFSS
jgi:acyl-CoA hydrolase